MFNSFSHELKTPLNFSINMLELLAKNISDKIALEDFVKPALNCNKILLSMINDVLDFVYTQQGKFKFNFTNFNLKALAQECFELFEYEAKLKQIKFELDYPEDMPTNINSDPQRIK
jgi:signal transduction histidine kinase